MVVSIDTTYMNRKHLRCTEFNMYVKHKINVDYKNTLKIFKEMENVLYKITENLNLFLFSIV